MFDAPFDEALFDNVLFDNARAPREALFPQPAADPFAQSPWLRFDASPDGRDDQAPLTVVFSHSDKPAGVFVQTRQVGALPGAKLYLNAPGNRWFLDGVPGFSRSLPETIDRIAEAWRGPIRFVGHSMGAFAALVAARRLGAPAIATGAELRLGLPTTRSGRFGVPQTALERFDAAAPGAAPTLIFGAYDPIDALFLAEAAEHGRLGAVFAAPSRHGVTERLVQLGVYRTLLREGASAAARLESDGVLRAPGGFGQPSRLRFFFQAYRAFKERDDLSTFVDRHPDWDNPGWQDLRAKMLDRLDRAEALEAAQRAVAHAPETAEFQATLGRLALTAGAHRLVRQVRAAATPEMRAHPPLAAFLTASAEPAAA